MGIVKKKLNFLKFNAVCITSGVGYWSNGRFSNGAHHCCRAMKACSNSVNYLVNKLKSKYRIPSNNRPSPKVANKSLLLHPRINVLSKYLPHFDKQPTIIIRLSKDVIFSENG